MNKRLVILGGGESGVGAALLANQKGYDVFLSDRAMLSIEFKNELINAGINFEEGVHTLEKILNATEVVKSPGISNNLEVVKSIKQNKIPIISEIELAYRYKGKSKIIAITGSNGKSTTTALIHYICKNAGLDAALVGNIGYSFARQVAICPKPFYVAEVSSFQLDDIKEFRPDIAVLTNITEDHLDRYDNLFENYIASKFKIIKNQLKEDYFIYNLDDEVTMKFIQKYSTNTTNLLPITMHNQLKQGAFINDGEMYVRLTGEYMQSSVFDFALKGIHNQYNSMAASVATATLKIRKKNIREALQSFPGLEHRMEEICTLRGVRFINDSKATNVNSVWFALESLQQPVILILGGIDKGNEYEKLYDLVKEKVKAIVCLGKDNKKIHQAFQKIVPVIVDSLSAEEAATKAFAIAQKGDTVLLSPACASFDLFKNFEDRGKRFKTAVKNL